VVVVVEPEDEVVVVVVGAVVVVVDTPPGAAVPDGYHVRVSGLFSPADWIDIELMHHVTKLAEQTGH